MSQTTPNYTQTVAGWVALGSSGKVTPFVFKRSAAKKKSGFMGEPKKNKMAEHLPRYSEGENGIDDVTIKILYCGMCHTDLHHIKNDWGITMYPLVLGVVNGALEYLAKDLGIAENIVLQGWVVSSTIAGATVGSFTGGALADKFGRTRTFQLDAIPLAIGAFLCATSRSVQTMKIGRGLCGIGRGISSAIVPLYISEILPTEIRGALGSVNQLFIYIGIPWGN